jgi:outer membrane protein TolC
MADAGVAVPRQAPVLTLSAALRSALQSGSAARSETLDRLQRQALWEAAQAEFALKPSLSSRARRLWSGGTPGRSDEAGIAAGATWKLPTGTQFEASLLQDLNRSPDGSARALTRVLEVVQPLLKGAGTAAGLALEQARLAERIGQYQRSQALDETYVAVSLAYFDAVLAHQQVGLAQRALERVAQAQAVNRSLHQAGRLAQVELLQSDADLAQAELELEQARNAAQSTASALLLRLGTDLAGLRPGDLRLPDGLPTGPLPLLAEPQALAQAQAGRADLMLAETAMAAARLAVAQALDEGRATLNLALRVQSSTGAALASAPVTPGTDRSIGVTWELPLDRSLLRLQRTQARLDLRRAELALEDAQRQMRSEVADALRDLGFAQRQLALAAGTVELNRRKLDAETERFRAGKTSGFQLSAAQDALRAAESGQAQAALAVQRAMMQQDRALGALAARRQALMQATASPEDR